ncbi:MAG: IS110 family transposase [Bacteroidales bacterium]|jgi:transposase|nr:IS110 family transposase [Bacteroidales bacterium]
MNFIGIDLHTNRFTCCYRNEQSSVDNPKDKRIETFDLNDFGLAQFFKTLTADTYVLIEATITTFSFARLFKDLVKEVVIANTYELKQISLARCNTDKIDADKLCRIIKMQALTGEQLVSPVTIPPKAIQDLRSLFSTYRLYQKQNTQLKNRIHSLVKERLYGFTQEEIFDKKSRAKIRELSSDPALKFQLNQLMDRLERDEADVEALKEQVLLHAEPYMGQIDILTSMKGVSVFIAIAIIADIIDVSRFKDSKHFTSYLRSAPHVANSNTSSSSRGTNKKGRKLSSSLLTQSLNHVLNASLKLRKWYDRLSEYKKAGLVRTGLRRRVFAEIYQMLKKGEYHYDMDAHNHETKMTQYRKFLEKNGGNLAKTA